MPKNDLVSLRHMLDAAREAVGFATGRKRIDLEDDRMLNLSIVRLIEMVGEAAGRVSSATQQRHAQVPWSDIIGMRHRLAHGYDDVDLDIVWQVITVDLPPLIAMLETILAAGTTGGVVE